MKVKAHELKEEERIEVLDALYTAASSVKGRNAVKLFLRDLLTESERIMLGRRIVIARRLLAGASYSDIEAEMKVGRDTIWRVQRWLSDQMPGYETAIAEMEREFARRREKRDAKELYARSALYRLKKKYPMHFLLFPTPTLVGGKVKLFARGKKPRS
jgi:uncharacterized protein YerC